jgi:predicted nucleic acid-binding protein
LDASVAASWAFPDELAPIPRQRLYERQIHVPGLWWFEVRNILVVHERRGRISVAGTAEFLSALGGAPVATDHEPDSEGVLRWARGYRLSVYDAAYLELAVRLQAGLATLDRKLAAAAEAAGVEVVGAGL